MKVGIAVEQSPTRCPGCGLVVIGGAEGCQRLFDDESARAYGDPRYAARRRMIVDAYCLQHPDRYCVSAISLAAHLSGLCVAVEQRDREVALNAAIQRWLSTRPTLEKPALPAARGSLTIADVAAARDLEAHARMAGDWALDVWAAYADLHEIARDWIRAALEPLATHR